MKKKATSRSKAKSIFLSGIRITVTLININTRNRTDIFTII